MSLTNFAALQSGAADLTEAAITAAIAVVAGRLTTNRQRPVAGRSTTSYVGGRTTSRIPLRLTAAAGPASSSDERAL